MKAIQFDLAIPRNAFGRALIQFAPETMVNLGRLVNRVYSPLLWSGLLTTYLADVPEPRLPNEEWVVIKTRYGGICGSDKHLIHLQHSNSMAAFGSFPFTIGHENFGTVAEAGKSVHDYSVGERVVAEPTLWCKPRGFTDLCRYCAQGEIQLCERLTEGAIAPGVSIGHCRDTGGSWSPYFVAHESQIVRIPDAVSDENALMLEPFATSLHAAVRNRPRDDETVLILGAGVIGLGVIAALRAIESRARIIVLARHKIQQEMARQFGADIVVAASRTSDYEAELARAVNARLLKQILGERVLMGGADIVFECVGSSNAIEDALRFTRAGGRVVATGIPSVLESVDWTSVWLKELRIHGGYIYGYEDFQGKRWRTFDLALDLMQRGKVNLAPMLTHRFALRDYARAFQTISDRGRERAVKVVFEF